MDGLNSHEFCIVHLKTDCMPPCRFEGTPSTDEIVIAIATEIGGLLVDDSDGSNIRTAEQPISNRFSDSQMQV